MTPARQGESNAIQTHVYKGPLLEHGNSFESAAKRHKLTEHIETPNSVHHVHHDPSIAKHRRRDSQYPIPLTYKSTAIVADFRVVIAEEYDEASERGVEGSNIDRESYVGVWLALYDVDRGGSVNGDWYSSSPEPAAHGELVLVHYFFFCFLGGVTGRTVLMPP